MTCLSDHQQIVFVGGLHRSGTTMLAQLLGAHPDASGLTATGISEDEGQFLQSTYLRDAELGGAGRFAFDPRAERGPCEDAAEAAELRIQLLRSWERFWDIRCRLLIEKTPGNCLNARFLESVFGDQCCFVFITRHPIANALATRKWSRTSLFALTEHWLHAQERMRAQFGGLRRAAWIAYETLVAEPERTLDGLGEFLGLAGLQLGPRALQDYNAPYFADWHRSYDAGMVQLPDPILRGELQDPSVATRMLWWLRMELRRSLLRTGVDVLSTGREAGALVAHYETRVRGFGYSLRDTALRPAVAQFLGPNKLSSFGQAPAPRIPAISVAEWDAVRV